VDRETLDSNTQATSDRSKSWRLLEIVIAINVSGQNFTLLDGGPMYKPTPATSFYYICEKIEELDRIWNAFSKEGIVMMSLDKYPWGEKYGWISDKFGISWQWLSVK
jgi:predicted 3-demethylubiquinone-9 3-methyltransferase (glyoxalase superfamily)